ncbi:vWA domain-containing protein [Candidatus Laterigemmans baculatus]|nr:VWA domain-containing protein [Candidatus Laterigemmans baculatus]
MVLIVFMLFTFVAAAAITVDFAHMQLAKTELRVATDAAAKAGAEALARTENRNQARAAAVEYARLNTVAGEPFRIRRSDVELGRLAFGSNGRWEFVPNLEPANAVRVDGRTGGGARHSAIPLYFGQILGRDSFSPRHQATAGQQQVEICLCLDRSGSMLFDMSGEAYSYAPGNPYLIANRSMGEMWRNHVSPPHPTASRWAVLARAVDVFLDEAADYNPPPRTSLVTWGSDYQMPLSPYTRFERSSVNVPLPSPEEHSWPTNRSAVASAVEQLGRNPMMGSTNLAAGLDAGIEVLAGPNSRTLPNKVIILLTDGQWNEGRDPVAAAEDAKAANIVVHTITMMTAHQADLAEVAEITGGRYYHTRSEQELREAFQELARSIQVVLIE